MEGFWILHQVTIPPRLLLQTSPESISKAAALKHDPITESNLGWPRSNGPCRHSPGPIDTDMNRGFEIPKASPESAAAGIFDGPAVA